MEVKEIIEHLRYYTGELPKEALEESIKNKEKMIPELLKMLDYTEENLDNIYNEQNDFYGYIYAIFLLAEFREKRLFPYLIKLLNKDEEYVEYFIGDDYTEYIPRLLASSYNGDDEALFNIIEDNKKDEFIRSSVLQTFSILYLYGEKSREFILNYFRKLINDKKVNDASFLYHEIFNETESLRLIELEDVIEKTFDCIEDEREIQGLKETFLNTSYEIDMDLWPFNPFYKYISNTIEIMKEWQCFCYKEDEEFYNSEDYQRSETIIEKRITDFEESTYNLGRNDLCYCGSGKKYKKCCMNKFNDKIIEKLNFIDSFVAHAKWLQKRNNNKKAIRSYRFAWIDVKDICDEEKITSISEYDDKYKGYDTLSDWIQYYIEALEGIEGKNYNEEKIKLCENLEKMFNYKGKKYEK